MELIGVQHRTGAPIRRDSAEAGAFEETFFAISAKGETDRLLHVARRTLDAERRLRRDARSGARELTPTQRKYSTGGRVGEWAGVASKFPRWGISDQTLRTIANPCFNVH